MDPTKYDPRDVPVSGTDRSRFLIATSAAGISMPSPAATALHCFGNLVAGNLDAAVGLAPERKTIALKRVALAGQVAGAGEGEGAYRLVDRTAVVGVQTVAHKASGKFAAVPAGAGALLDLFFLGEITARPEAIWRAALAFAEEHQLDGGACRRLSDLIAQQICLNAGVIGIRDRLTT